MKIQCPKCNKTYRLPDDRIPQSGALKARCKHCGAIIDIGPQPSESPPSSSVKDTGISGDVEWFIAVGKERRGPFTTDDILKKLSAGEINNEVFIWKKGFQKWERLADVPEFKVAVSSVQQEEVGETQLMSVHEIEDLAKKQLEAKESSQPESLQPEPKLEMKELTSKPKVSEPVESRDQKEADGQKMVWQRHETSVLFSLDEYKTRRKTQGIQAVGGGEQQAVVEIKPLEEPISPIGGGTPQRKGTIGVIKLEEEEVRHVAEALARKKRQKRYILYGAGGVLGLVIVVGVVIAIVIALSGDKGTQQVVTEQTTSEPKKSQEPQPQPQPQVASVQPSTPASSKEEPVESTKAPQEAKKEVKDVTKEKKVKEEKKKETEVAAVQPPPVKKETEIQTGGGSPKDDVNALLNAYKSGKGGSAPSSSTGKTEEKADGDLPEQLSMAQVRSILSKAQPRVVQCVQNSGAAPGSTVTVTTRVVISGSGSVSSVSVQGAGNAQGCVESALKGLQFPKFKGEPMTVPYPFRVQL